ncbi:MAG: SDR family oxidoreductase [Chloroflexota bacterium]|nr:SDR family oxidoreductase [Chloroflexota bacterium]
MSAAGNDLFRLDGQVALVTGGARGLGQAMATALAQAGAAVCVADILPAEETLDLVAAYGQPGHALVTDLAALDPGGADTIMQQVVEKLGPPSILVNNAGIIRRAPAISHSWEDWQQTIALDLSAPFLLSQALARHLVARESPGKIVNVASMLSYQGGYLVPGYTAAKSGIAGLTRALANEWACYGINVNAIAPGYMATELTAMLRSDPSRAETMLARIPAGRWGEPEDLAGAVVFLCSRAADYIHGTVLPIDGGWLAW